MKAVYVGCLGNLDSPGATSQLCVGGTRGGCEQVQDPTAAGRAWQKASPGTVPPGSDSQRQRRKGDRVEPDEWRPLPSVARSEDRPARSVGCSRRAQHARGHL